MKRDILSTLTTGPDRPMVRALARDGDAVVEERLIDPSTDHSALGLAAAAAARADRSAETEVEGRTWFLEVHNPPLELVLVGASAVELKKKAIERGMITLRRSGLIKVAAGMTTLEEVARETIH